jgi:uncharacterized membrane protein YbhN (UPF0104 family)
MRRLRWVGRSPVVRLVGTGVALLLLVQRVNLGRAMSALGHADPRLELLGVGLTGLGLLCEVVGWAAVINATGSGIALPRLASWYLQGIFVGQVTPSGAGGDAVRAMGASRAIGAGRGLASLAASRLATGLSVAACGLAGAVMAKVYFGIPVLIGAGAYLAMMLLVWWLALGAHGLTRRLGGSRRRPLAMLGRAAAPVTEALGRSRQRPGALAALVALALAGWILNIFALQTFAAAVGIHQPPAVFAVAFPISLIATAVPLAVNGIGLREGVLVGVLAHVGETAVRSGALALLIDVQLVPFALAGAALMLLARRAQGRPASPALVAA